ncbi:MAG: hypothetical protein V4556_13190 [Bacteroidota bacterium]
MGISAFKRLDKVAQLEVIYEIGDKVAELEDHSYVLELFQVYDFYVQITSYSKTNVLFSIKSFDINSEVLDRYLTSIPIPVI